MVFFLPAFLNRNSFSNRIPFWIGLSKQKLYNFSVVLYLGFTARFFILQLSKSLGLNFSKAFITLNCQFWRESPLIPIKCINSSVLKFSEFFGFKIFSGIRWVKILGTVVLRYAKEPRECRNLTSRPYRFPISWKCSSRRIFFGKCS